MPPWTSSPSASIAVIAKLTLRPPKPSCLIVARSAQSWPGEPGLPVGTVVISGRGTSEKSGIDYHSHNLNTG